MHDWYAQLRFLLLLKYSFKLQIHQQINYGFLEGFSDSSLSLSDSYSLLNLSLLSGILSDSSDSSMYKPPSSNLYLEGNI